MIDLRAWAGGGLRFGAIVFLAAALFGCANGTSGSTGPGTGGSDGGGGQGGTGAAGGGGAGGATCQPEQEICDGKDNDCNGEIDDVPGLPMGCVCDEGATQECYTGEPGTEGVGECAKGQQTCVGGTWGECTGQVVPADEECNLKDDDCNGTVDDMGQASCGIGECAATVEKCVNGVLQTCVAGQPTVEVCDGKDNNCNQLTDETDPMVGQSCLTGDPGACAQGKYQCNAGALSCVGASPAMELCDGVDNDCNGTVDDVQGTGGACSTGALGVCATGVISCQNIGGAWQVDCFSVVTASPEVCDGLDNDCNGQNDEGDPGGGAACDTGLLGACQPGVQHCVNGSIQCVQNKMPVPESCNGQDDNCDGQVDEGDPGGGIGCGTGVPGICATGVTSCTNGAIACNQTVMPQPETCNGQDDDCNGQVDEGNPGGGAVCSTGNLGVCAAGTITCQGGVLACAQDVQPSAEVCGNAIDENCDGVAVAAPTLYFEETFANNMAGWTLTGEWAIGPTVASAANGSCGGGDPAADHTPTGDNGVAGAVLGGNISTTVGGPYYLTSPVIDVSAAPTLFLEYWRWLHSDYPNFMIDKVEVYNGSAWVAVWNNPSATVVNDTAWTKMSHDVTAHKNASFQIRFSFQIGSTGAYTCSGWNVDDIQLVNAQCN